MPSSRRRRSSPRNSNVGGAECMTTVPAPAPAEEEEEKEVDRPSTPPPQHSGSSKAKKEPPVHRWVGKGQVQGDGCVVYQAIEVLVGGKASIVRIGDSALLYSGSAEEEEEEFQEEDSESGSGDGAANSPGGMIMGALPPSDEDTEEELVDENEDQKYYGAHTNMDFKSLLDPYVARVVKMWEEPVGGTAKKGKKRRSSTGATGQLVDPGDKYNSKRKLRMKIRAQWYFKKEDMAAMNGYFQGITKKALIKDMVVRDLVLGNHTDDNEVPTLLGRCRVVRRRPLPPSKKGKTKPKDDVPLPKKCYVCRFEARIPKVGQKDFGSVLIDGYKGEPDDDHVPAKDKARTQEMQKEAKERARRLRAPVPQRGLKRKQPTAEEETPPTAEEDANKASQSKAADRERVPIQNSEKSVEDEAAKVEAPLPSHDNKLVKEAPKASAVSVNKKAAKKQADSTSNIDKDKLKGDAEKRKAQLRELAEEKEAKRKTEVASPVDSVPTPTSSKPPAKESETGTSDKFGGTEKTAKENAEEDAVMKNVTDNKEKTGSLCMPLKETDDVEMADKTTEKDVFPVIAHTASVKIPDDLKSELEQTQASKFSAAQDTELATVDAVMSVTEAEKIDDTSIVAAEGNTSDNEVSVAEAKKTVEASIAAVDTFVTAKEPKPVATDEGASTAMEETIVEKEQEEMTNETLEKGNVDPPTSTNKTDEQKTSLDAKEDKDDIVMEEVAEAEPVSKDEKAHAVPANNKDEDASVNSTEAGKDTQETMEAKALKMTDDDDDPLATEELIADKEESETREGIISGNSAKASTITAANFAASSGDSTVSTSSTVSDRKEEEEADVEDAEEDANINTANPNKEGQFLPAAPTRKQAGVIHVGEGHQSLVPPLSDLVDRASYASKFTAAPVWTPGKIDSKRVNRYLSEARFILKKFALEQKDGYEFEDDNTSYMVKEDVPTTASPLPVLKKVLARECNGDPLLAELHNSNYDIDAALTKVRAHPKDFLTLWSAEEREKFEQGFSRHCGLLRTIAKAIPTKSCKEVVDYHYRFKIPHQFRKYEEQKKEQARRMMEAADLKLIDKASAGQPMKKSGRNFTKGGATEHRRLMAKDFLVYTRDRIGAEKYCQIANLLKDYHAKDITLTDLKSSILQVLDGDNELVLRFNDFLPKKIRS